MTEQNSAWPPCYGRPGNEKRVALVLPARLRQQGAAYSLLMMTQRCVLTGQLNVPWSVRDYAPRERSSCSTFADGSRTEAARILGLDRSTLWRPLRELVGVALTIEGFMVTEAFDVASMRWWLHTKTQDRYPDEAFDLIVTDVHMPRGPGLVALESLRRHGCHTPAIVVTAFAGELTHQKVAQLKARLISKPFKLDDIRAAAVTAVCDRLLRGKRS